MDVSKKTITDIFTGRRVLQIPFFQRSYVWKEEQWERFKEDMEYISEHPQDPYFFGSLILKQKLTKTEAGPGDVRMLIDGQQRLTTLIIFFHVVWLMCKDKSDDNYDSLKSRFRLDRSPKELAFRHNHNDQKSFEKILDLEQMESITEKNKIIETYNFFKDNTDIGKLNVDAILDKVTFVVIDLSLEEDEQQIFDTINSLGVRLTTAELLKNYFFDKDHVLEYEENWKNIFEGDDETKEYWDKEFSFGKNQRAFIDLFFSAYLQIKMQEPDLNTEKLSFRVDNIFELYKKLIKDRKQIKGEFIREIKGYASLFRANFDDEVLKLELPQEPGIERINAIIFGLENSTLIPYTLFILRNVTDAVQRQNLFGSIETYIMRRMVCNAGTKNYNQLLDNMIRHKILSKTTFLEQINKSDDSVNFLPNNKALEKGFNESRLINKQAAGILYFIESKIKEQDKPLSSLLGFSGYSLEHLMPKKWKNNWKKLPDPVAEAERDKVLRTLGNLAIIPQALNASFRDSNWKTKKGKTRGRKKGLIFYGAGIETLHDCLEVDDWNEGEIKNRAKWLCEQAIEVWPVE